MNGKGVMAGLMVLAAGGVTLGLLGGEGKGDGGTEPVAIVEELRPVVLEGLCPASTATEAPKCKEAIQMDGRCLCLSSQKAGQVDGELADSSALPAAARVRLVVCSKDGKETVASWEKDAGEVKPDCVVAARPMVDVSIDGDTDLVEILRESCAPCQVSGRSWGPCPHCLKTAGGCAAACPVEVVTP